MRRVRSGVHAVYVLIAVIWICGGTSVHAQDYGMLDEEYRTRYSQGLIGFRFAGGINRYLGDFTPRDDTRQISMSAMYTVRTFLSAGLSIDYGIMSYFRERSAVDPTLYDFQFGPMDGERSTEYTAFHLVMEYAPIQVSIFDFYLLVGAGITVYDANDHGGDQVTVRPKADMPGTISVPFGAGLDIFVSHQVAVSTELRYHMVFKGDLDAYDEKLLTIDYIKGGGALPYQPEQIYDNLFTATVGLKVFLFRNDDYDGDLLPNWSEEGLGSNIYEPDSDDDGLSDYEETQHFQADPLVFDTDRDQLGDYDEVTIYRTHPYSKDTDTDGLDDFEETYRIGTNPLMKDTDGDGLTDTEEVRIGTDPTNVDSDYDGLTDYSEVRVHHTNPLKPDTDDDGVFDYNEVSTYRTNPERADSDGDDLTDYEEIAYHRTNPNARDTDGDTWPDDKEIVETRTNPLDRDTDSDGIWDNVDQCPLVPEIYNGIKDTDGCPDGLAWERDQYASANPDGGRTGRGKGVPTGLGEGDPNYGIAGSGGDLGDGDGRSGRGQGVATGEGEGDPNYGIAGSGGDLGEGDDRNGRGQGVSTGEGEGDTDYGVAGSGGDLGEGDGRGGRGTGVATGEGEGGADRGTVYGAGSEGYAGPYTEGYPGRGTGVSTGEGSGPWRINYGEVYGPDEEPLLARYGGYTPRAVQHIVPVSMYDTSAASSSRYDFAAANMVSPLPSFEEEKLEEGKVFTLTDVHFEYDKDVIRREYIADLLDKVTIFKAYPGMVVEIRGHTDAEGTDAYNQNLSMRRALAVKNFFVKQGVAPGRLKAKGYGESRPIMDNSTDIGRAFNRRVEVFIIKLGERMPSNVIER